MDIVHLLNEEIESRMKEIGGMKPESDEYKAAVDGVAKLIDRVNEINKLKAETDENEKNRELEKRDRLTRNIINVASIAVPAGITIWGTLKTLKFETTGTVTTLIGRGFINKLLPKK